MSRQQKPTPAEVQNTPVIKLYEDMTNILITSVKVEKSPEYPTLDEHILTCIYTYQNTEEHITFCKCLDGDAVEPTGIAAQTLMPIRLLSSELHSAAHVRPARRRYTRSGPRR